MSGLNIIENRHRVLSLIEEHVKRDGVDKLVKWLNSSDYFTAPASTKFHLACEGGLAKHSLNVFDRLLMEINAEFGDIENSKYTMETIVLTSLMHDLCKVGTYQLSYRNQKNEDTGQWEKVPFYKTDIYNDLPITHGAKSQYILRSFMDLTREESVAIISHMGGFDTSVKGGDYSVGNSFKIYKLALLLHVADMKATNIDEIMVE